MELKYIFAIVLLLIPVFTAWWMFFRKPGDKEFPSSWRKTLQDKVKYYNRLTTEEKDRYEQALLQFFDRVKITGVDVDLDDTDRLLIASSAVIPLFGFPGWHYRNLNEVLLYKGAFTSDYKTRGNKRNILGMVGSGNMNRMMILSKPSLRQGFENTNSKKNVGIHEFVHLVDKADGLINGLPEALMQQQYVIPWLHHMHEEIKEITERDSDINPYGATSEAEFLSVVSEYFFNQPEKFDKKHPELFDLLEKIYKQDFN